MGSRPLPQVPPPSVSERPAQTPRVTRARTPSDEATRRPSTVNLPPKFVEQAGRRLCGISLFVACFTVLTTVFLGYVDPAIAELHRSDVVVRLVLLAMVLLSAGVIAIQYFRVVPPRTLLVVGMVFEVAMAFCIAMIETTMPFNPDEPVRGMSSVAVWILAVGLLVPKRPMWTAIIAFTAASMWPLAYAINIDMRGLPPLPWQRLSVWLAYLYAIAGFAAVAGRRTYGVEVAAQRALDLGSYTLTSLIGQGGMGEVWRARHKMLAREAAIKIVRGDLIARASAHDADIAVRRFEREARATASLQSPHTVYLYDFGTAKDGSFYYVMELLDGISLQRLVSTFGPQPAARVIHIVQQICRSLDEAHRRGLVHRDLKPSNVMLCQVAFEFDVAKVLDFGLVKPTNQEDRELTADGISAGTPAYIAPEVALGDRHVDGRADIYALGCVAYYLLTGKLVFDEPTATAMSIAHVQKTPQPPSARTELPIPAALEQIVLQCLEKSPDARPQSAQDLIDLLASVDQSPWTPVRAEAWWNANLPATSTLRTCDKPVEDATPTIVQVA
jgi:serine/threonine-protein kinase